MLQDKKYNEFLDSSLDSEMLELNSKQDIFKGMRKSPLATIRLIGLVMVWFFGFESYFGQITSNIMKAFAGMFNIVLSEVDKGIINQTFNVIYFALAVIFTIAVMIGPVSLKHINFRLNKKEFKFILILFVLMYAWNVGSSLLINSLINKGSANQGAIESMSTNMVLTFVMTVVLAPFAEEMMYRVGLSGILSKASIPIAIIVSGFLFGFAHIQNYVMDPSHPKYDTQQWLWLINYGGMGVIFSYAYHRSGRFAIPYYLHMGNNLFAFVGMLILNFLK